MACVSFFIGVQDTSGRQLSKTQVHIGMEGPLVALQSSEVMPTAIQNPLGNRALIPHRINGDGRPT